MQRSSEATVQARSSPGLKLKQGIETSGAVGLSDVEVVWRCWSEVLSERWH
jgi:hypothetical protein